MLSPHSIKIKTEINGCEKYISHDMVLQFTQLKRLIGSSYEPKFPIYLGILENTSHFQQSYKDVVSTKKNYKNIVIRKIFVKI